MIAKSWFGRCWQWQIGGCVAIVGALSVGVSDRVNAQIVPDNTLGAEGSVVTPNVDINGISSDRIDGGATRDANLFHSFSQFNVGAGRGAYFTNPAGIQNILTRVTGANRSEILGRLGVLGDANLFLINPNGIVFGQDASLDVQGSFLATTANAVKLGDAGLFSASQPATSNLLTVSPSALWFNAVAAQPIVNRSQAPSSFGQPNSDDSPQGLQVQPGRTLALVGGDVLLEGGNLTAAGGRIELGSVAGVGQVSLSQTGNRFVLGYDSVSGFRNISLSSGAFVDASGEGGGDIQIRGARLEMTQGSNIRADTLGAENGSEVLVRATEVELSESSSLSAVVDGTGTGGDLTIETGQLLISDGAVVSTDAFDEGAGGNLTVLASERVEVTGSNVNGSPSGLASQSQGKGDAGELTIETGQLLISDGAGVSTSTINEGAGGNLTVLASERVEVTGSNVNGSPSFLSSQSQGKGDAGELTIETGQLLISDGAQVDTTAFNEGAGGNLTVLASERVEVTGSNVIDGSSSFLSSQSVGKGDAGEVTIETGQLLISDGAQVSTDAFNEGAGGKLTVLASERVQVTGSNVIDGSSSFLSSTSPGKGDAGELTIETGQLLISDGASVSTSAFNEGAGGNLTVVASERVQVTGTDVIDGSPSGLGSQSQGKGDAGDLTIETGQLLISDGAVVATSAFDEGAGGNLTVVASERVQVTGSNVNGSPSGLGSLSVGKGDAGEVTIETGQLLISDGALVSTSAFDEGAGGNLTVVASERVQVTGSNVNGSPSGLGSQSQGKGDAGEVTIETGQLLISDGASVSTDAFNEGAGGKLTVLASERVEVAGSNVNGFPSFLSSTSQGKGDAGEVTIETGQLLISNGARVSTSTINEGAGGKLTVMVSDSVLLNNQGSLEAASTGTGNTGNITVTVGGLLSATDSDINTSSLQSAGGAITIIAGDIRLFGDSDITTNVNQGAGGGGDITLTADSILAFDDSDILAFADDGKGGDVTFDTPAFFGENYRPAPPNTDPDTLENNNQVDINATGAVEGVITITSDTSFIQNSLTELPDNQINIDNLLANSCIVRRNQPTRGSFTITGSGGLPQRPGDAQMSTFPTVDIETLPSDGTPSNTNPNRPWQKGDPIVEPQGVYRLPNGKLVLSRECSRI